MPAPQVEWELDGRPAGTAKPPDPSPARREYQPPSYSQYKQGSGGQGPAPSAMPPQQQYPAPPQYAPPQQQYAPPPQAPYGAQPQPMPGQQYPSQYQQPYGAQPQPLPGQQYPSQYQQPYGAQPQPMPGQQYPPQYQQPYGAQPQPMPGQQYPPQYPPPYGAPGQPVSPMKAPGGVLAIVGMVFALGGMISVMVGNLVFTASAPVPCLIISFISGIIASALAGAAWAKGNKGAKGILAWGIIDIVMAVVIGLMWATAFG